MIDTPLQGQVPAPYVRLLYDWLEHRDVDAPSLLGEPAPVASEHGLARVSVAHWRRLLERAAAHLGDPLLGLRIGQTITPAHLGALGYALLACGTLGAALQRMERYQRLIYDVNALHQRIDGGSLVLSWGVEHGRPGALVDECAIAALIQFARNITGTRLAPEAIGFVNPAPATLTPYQEFFCATPSFGGTDTHIRFPLDSLALPLRQPDAGLLAILEAQAETQLSKLPGRDVFEQAVRRQIATLARDGEPSLERVAAALLLSPRTLRRKLQERGRQFRDLHDETLRRMAEDHLCDPRLQLAEVALLLGYSEQSAFTRAFRRWTGTTPAAFRRGGGSTQSRNTP